MKLILIVTPSTPPFSLYRRRSLPRSACFISAPRHRPRPSPPPRRRSRHSRPAPSRTLRRIKQRSSIGIKELPVAVRLIINVRYKIIDKSIVKENGNIFKGYTS